MDRPSRLELRRDAYDLRIEVDLPDPNGMLPGFSRARSYVPLSALGLTGSHDVDGHILSEFVTKAITDLVAMKDAHAFQAQPDLPTKAGADGVDTHTELADPTSKSRDGRCHICNEALQDLCSTCKETVTPLVAVYTSGKNKIHCKHVSGVCNHKFHAHCIGKRMFVTCPHDGCEEEWRPQQYTLSIDPAGHKPIVINYPCHAKVVALKNRLSLETGIFVGDLHLFFDEKAGDDKELRDGQILYETGLENGSKIRMQST